MKDEKLVCCEMECDKEAEWEIQWVPRSPDDYTFSCTAHVGEMLCDSPIHYIYLVEARARSEISDPSTWTST